MKLFSTLLAISVSVSSFATYAKIESFDAKVKVQNTVVLTKGPDDLDFGTIRAVADPTGNNQATLTINPEPTANPISSRLDNAPAIISIIAQGKPTSFTVSEVVPNARLTISDPTATVLDSDGQGLNEPNFTVSGWTYFITTGPNANTYYTTGSPNLTADSDGNVSFNIGATLSTASITSSEAYRDTEYTGTFQLEVAY
ncbi:DUF4402 domain-containing protein [Pseudoalteromonas sp. KG3]|uniref:DUF4402 domain-containing protein n=1 Tax=Pseudoalteromonas prydzensis TaxID=182141 RepID=A0ABR9FLH3_9GAMM|nr:MULTISPECIES: DUF4402 domain-containing protein [Pseudoalteromonas]MBE0457642.1 DUF4402 domain-containing protein [Pseudoalteromonas prydzensis]WKD24750.1 DUF4402 domain-containing protein [Pseudoalteromonas sp. KG3]